MGNSIDNTRPIEDALNQRIAELTTWNATLADTADDLRAKNAEYARYISDEQLEEKAIAIAEKKNAALWVKAITALQEQPKLQARIDDLTHKNEMLMDSYLEPETINDKGELVGSLEFFRKRIATLEEALRWRPVWEQPEKSGYYEVEFDNGNFHDMIFYNEHSSWRCNQEHVNITGWRPIPEASE